MREAVREWVWTVGQDRAEQQWVLSDYDTWERNPHYRGPDQGHPEDYCETKNEVNIFTLVWRRIIWTCLPK